MTTARDDDYIQMWDPCNRALLMMFKEQKFKPAPNTLWTTNEYGGVVLAWHDSRTQITWWQYDSQEKYCSFTTKEQLTWIKILNNGTHIVGGSKAGNLYFWNAQSGNLIAEISAHYESINNICISADCSLILTTCIGGVAKLWIIGDILSSSEGKLTFNRGFTNLFRRFRSGSNCWI